ncbi:MAG: hypothetical protein C0623_01940 [Desulfuromonas sp.]|nr:MAG: hypothetical protein C0623_01940 [Desulfuromonas sp.]
MEKDRILAIEDDEGVCRLLRHSLAREDYVVRITHSGEEGLIAANEEPPDLFLLDLELPGMDGLEVCQKLKENPQASSIPIIILTGKGEESDVVEGLGMGADDYIVKPFSPKILNARVQAVLRRHTKSISTPAQQEQIQCGPLQIDTGSNRIILSGKEIELGLPEYRFALLLISYLSNREMSEICQEILADENPDNVISRDGMALYSENRLGRLTPVLEALVSSGFDSPLLHAFYALVLFEKDPERGGGYMRQTAQQYAAAEDPLGELVALSHLVFYHVVFDGDARNAERYLERAEVLNKAYFDRLSVFSRVAVAQNLAIGRAFLLNDFAASNEYLQIAEALAEDRGLVNLVVLNRLVRVSEAYVRGDQETMMGVLEDCVRFANHPQVSHLHKALLKLMQLKCSALIGDFRYLQIQKEHVSDGVGAVLGRDNLASAQLITCRLEALNYAGHYEEALQLCDESLQRPRIAENDLVRPFLNGCKALSAAICGEESVAFGAISDCRSEPGGMTFRRALAKLFCARALAHLGELSEAKELLYRIAPFIIKGGWHSLGLQLRAQQLLLPGNEPGDTIGALMADMRERNSWYLQTLIGDDYCRFYQLARDAGEGESFAREILRKRLMLEVDADGVFYPVLRISTLGRLELSFNGRVVAGTEEFSRTQRECLALLAAAAGHRVPQEEVQLTFWPDKSPEKARSTLDTMLSRLRRLLKDKLQPQPVKRYLKLQKGVLGLEGVAVDAVEVASDIARAREFVRRREFWQADATYAVALERWRGQFVPGSCSADRAAVYARHLQQLCLDASLEWSELLNESGQMRRSIGVLTHALSMDRCNELIMKALYRSQMRDGNIAAANQLLVQYEKVMKSEGCGSSEIARVLTSFKTSDES